MNESNYQRVITVDASPEAVFAALTSGYSHWWTHCDAMFSKVGDRIRFGFPPNISYWTFEAVTLIPNELVQLECVDALHKLIEKPNSSKTEWLGTQVIWKICVEGGRTRIEFEHVGLRPELDCYDICEAGWDLFFVNSLKAYLDTGTGMPHRI